MTPNRSPASSDLTSGAAVRHLLPARGSHQRQDATALAPQTEPQAGLAESSSTAIEGALKSRFVAADPDRRG